MGFTVFTELAATTDTECRQSRGQQAEEKGCRASRSTWATVDSNTTLYLWQPQDFNLCEQRNTLVFSGTPNFEFGL